ncbi:MAG: methyl-accepting chemotaxis protein, partial [Actinomycetota bacterium]
MLAPNAEHHSPQASADAPLNATETRRFGIGAKITAGVGVLLVALAGTASWQMGGIDDLGKKTSHIVENDTAAQVLLLNIDRDAYQAQIAIEQMVTADPSEVAGFVEGYEGNRDQTQSRWNDYQAVARGIGDEESRWPAYDAARSDWIAITDGISAQLSSGSASAADPQLIADLASSRAAFDGVRDVLDGIVEEIYVPNQETMLSELDEKLDGKRSITWMSAAFIGILLIVGGALLIRSISAPIKRITGRARSIADGHTDVDDLEMNRSDEIGDLATAFNDMSSMLSTVGDQAHAIADGHMSAPVLREELPGPLGAAFGSMTSSITDMVDQLKHSSQQLAGAAEELTAVSTSMSSSAERTSSEATSASATGDEVSASVGTVAAAIEQMNASIREVSTNATDASNVANDAVQVARVTSDSVAKLGESSEEIGNVIKVINSIAEQTNL